jgi:hypothetical protein
MSALVGRQAGGYLDEAVGHLRLGVPVRQVPHAPDDHAHLEQLRRLGRHLDGPEEAGLLQGHDVDPEPQLPLRRPAAGAGAGAVERERAPLRGLGPPARARPCAVVGARGGGRGGGRRTSGAPGAALPRRRHLVRLPAHVPLAVEQSILQLHSGGADHVVAHAPEREVAVHDVNLQRGGAGEHDSQVEHAEEESVRDVVDLQARKGRGDGVCRWGWCGGGGGGGKQIAPFVVVSAL